MSITNRITGDQKISGFVNIYNQNNENIENALKEYKDDYKKLDSEIKGKLDNELKRIKNNLTSDVVNLNQNINKFEEKIEKITDGFQSEVDNQIKSVIEIFRNEYKNDIDNIKEDVQSNIDEKIINSKNEVFSSVDEKLDILKKSITSLETKYDDDTKKISINIKELQNKIETSEKTSEKTQKDITQHYKDIEKIKNDITNLNELFNFKLDVNKKLDEIESKIIDLDAHVSLHVSNYMNSENTKKFINDSVNDSVNHLIDTDDFKDNLKNEITNEIQELKNEDIKQINDSLKNTNIILKYCCDCLDILKQKMEISNDEWPEIPNEII